MKNSIFLIVLVSFVAVKSFTIDCQYNRYNQPVVGYLYTCHAKNIPITSGNEITNVTGEHLSGFDNNDVKSIYFYGNWSLTFFPRGISKIFPNIEAFKIDNFNFDKLYGDELNEFPNLRSFSISYSKLTTVSSKLFEATPKLILINLNYAAIERVGKNLFTPLNVTQLYYVSFYQNKCTNAFHLNGNQTAIVGIIEELKKNCPFDDEFSTTTEEVTTFPSTSSTEKNLTCSEKNVKELICEIKEEIQALSLGMQEIKEELLKISAKNCAC